MQSLNKIPTIALAILLAISIVVSLMFFFGGDVDPNAEYPEPTFTGSLLNWGYILFVLTAVVTIILAIAGFIIRLGSDFRSAIISICGISAVIILLLITYFSADVTPYANLSEDTDQSEVSMRLTNMCVVSSFILAGIVTLVTLLGFLIKRIK